MQGATLFLAFTSVILGVYVAYGINQVVILAVQESFEYGACCTPNGQCLELEARDCLKQVSVNGTGRFLGSSVHCTDFPQGMCYSTPCPDNTAAYVSSGQCACNTSKVYQPALPLPTTCFNVTLRGCLSPGGVCVDAEPAWCSTQSFTTLSALCTSSGAGACSNPTGCFLASNATRCSALFPSRVFYPGLQCISESTNFGK